MANVWAVEFWEGGHWKVAVGGLTKAAAKKAAKAWDKPTGPLVSIAEYSRKEGSSAVSREALPGRRR